MKQRVQTCHFSTMIKDRLIVLAVHPWGTQRGVFFSFFFNSSKCLAVLRFAATVLFETILYNTTFQLRNSHQFTNRLEDQREGEGLKLIEMAPRHSA
jgi:hypothetical protein